VPVSIENKKLQAVVDTAAEVTIINQKVVPAHLLSKCVKSVSLKPAFPGNNQNGQLIRNVNLKVGSQSYSVDMVIADIDDDILLGYDFLKSHNCILNLVNNTISIGSEIIPATEKRNPGSIISLSPVYVAKRTVVPPNCSKLVKCSLQNSVDSSPDMVIEPILKSPLFVPKSVVKNNQSIIKVINPTDNFVTLKRKVLIGNAIPIADMVTLSDDNCSNSFGLDSQNCENQFQIRQNQINSDITLPSHLQSLYERSIDTLNDDQKLRLKVLLSNFSDVFAKNDFDLGHFTSIQHKINTGDSVPTKPMNSGISF